MGYIGYNSHAKRIENTSDIPTTEHWAILETGQYSTDHGYPESGSSTYNYLVYFMFVDKQEWQKEVISLLKESPHRSDLRFIHVKPVNPDVDIKIEIKF